MLCEVSMGGETVFESRLSLGYMLSNFYKFNYFVELGASALPQNMNYFGKYPNGSIAFSAVNDLSANSYGFGRIGAMYMLTDRTYTYLHGTIEHGYDEQFSFTPYSVFGEPVYIPSTAYGGGAGIRILITKHLFYDTSYTFTSGGTFSAFVNDTNTGTPLEVLNSPRRSTFIASIGGLF